MSKLPIPVGDKVIVLPLKTKEEKTESGALFVPETANAQLEVGQVVAVSSDLNNLYAVGDEVLFSHGSGLGAFYNGKPHVWLFATHIFGILLKKTTHKDKGDGL